MALYEIDIHRSNYGVPVDMNSVYSALELAGIEVDKEERRGSIYNIDSSDDQPEYVYVDAGDVIQAVGVINALGYTTDEDEDDKNDEEEE